MDALCVGCGSEFSIYNDHHVVTVEPKEDSVEPGCTCDPPKKHYCIQCGIQRNPTTKEWEPLQENLKPVFSQTHHISRCEHIHEAVTLPNGVVVHCSSFHNRVDNFPDFGLYADYMWRPTWRNEFINWPDFKAPLDPLRTFDQIMDLYDKAYDRLDVEFGCIGGHGRTGTILACLVALVKGPSFSTNDAIDWVRENYCQKAVESAPQVWFIEFFRHVAFPSDVPEPEDCKVPKNDNVCSLEVHYAMWKRGHKQCFDKGAICNLWKLDALSFSKDDVQDIVISDADKLLGNYPPRLGGLLVEGDDSNYPHSLDEHLAMLYSGWDECAIYGSGCPEWIKDKEVFDSTPNPESTFGDKWKQFEIAAPIKRGE